MMERWYNTRNNWGANNRKVLKGRRKGLLTHLQGTWAHRKKKTPQDQEFQLELSQLLNEV